MKTMNKTDKFLSCISDRKYVIFATNDPFDANIWIQLASVNTVDEARKICREAPYDFILITGNVKHFIHKTYHANSKAQSDKLHYMNDHIGNPISVQKKK
jgi:hypothetical protein